MTMDADSQDFFEELEQGATAGFKGRFGKLSRRLALKSGLKASELSLLYEAAFLAALCNIAFNGLGGCDGEISPEKEPTRRRLEQAFMEARKSFYACRGWKALPAARKKSIQAAFLTVLVSEENLEP